ncbi:ATP-dependent helicase HrpB [Rhodospirillum rubrum F11]|nr:ATP-dependent helicase HrpB [Rhodospirillum rubrum F11]
MPALLEALASHGRAVLIAPPGAGKTTRVPPALLGALWLGGQKVVMLEPRRLATRAAARRMAFEAGEAVGQRFGFRVRGESRSGPLTRVEVMTEGILTRRIQDDPELAGVGCVILDEFHERGLQGDLAFALLREIQGALRPDLRLLVMSATLDGAAIAALMDDAPVIESHGRAFPVTITHGERPAARDLGPAMARTILRALEDEPGSVLAFLPGEREIAAVAGALARALPADTVLRPLYGALPPAEQDAAISPCPPGQRKVVLATDIAETSLTIEGVRIVVDSGLRRSPRFDPQTGLSRLDTVRISQAGAEQRRGRAGRLEPGVCLRLWPEAEHRALPAQETPEILAADLAPLALELARWGARDAAALCWPTPPPPGPLAQARDLLTSLGALEPAGGLSAHGAAMAALPLHPRLAHMVLAAKADGADDGALACLLAALLAERDILRPGPGAARDRDLTTRLEILIGQGRRAPAGQILRQPTLGAVRDEAARLRQLAGIAASASPEPARCGRVLARAYPDRIAQARPGQPGRFLLSSGRGALIDVGDPLAAAAFLAVAEVDGAGSEARVFLAAPLDRADLEELFDEALRPCETVTWDPRAEAVVARVERRLGALVFESRDLPDRADPARTTPAVCAGIRRLGLGCLPWTRETDRLRARVAFLHRVHSADDWPDLSDDALLASLADWLGPWLDGITRRSAFARIDLMAALKALIGWRRLADLDRLAPAQMDVPSGVKVALDYEVPDGPVLAARVQQLFGLTRTPAVLDGGHPVLVHLLSPAGRPLQVTRDLAGFWKGSYAEVRKDMRGRYPKHPWPEDPTGAEATNRVKPRGQ